MRFSLQFTCRFLRNETSRFCRSNEEYDNHLSCAPTLSHNLTRRICTRQQIPARILRAPFDSLTFRKSSVASVLCTLDLMANRAAALVVLALLGCAAFAHAQEPVCKTYKKLLTASEPKMLMDTITVTDSGPVQSVSVSGVSVAYPQIGNLQVTLLHGVPGSPTPASFAVLKSGRAGADGANLAGTAFSDAATADFPAAEVAPFTGTFKPAQPLAGFAGQDAAGSWVLRIADVSQGSSTPSPITLTGWTVQICFAGTPVPVPTAAQGPTLNVAAPGASVTLGSEGLNVTVFPQNGTNTTADVNVTSQNGPMDKFRSTKFGNAMAQLLMPFDLPQAPQGSGFTGPLSKAKDMVHDAMVTEVIDVVSLIEAKSNAIKNYLNKKLGDYINNVNSASTMAQGLVKGANGQMGSHMKTMMAELVAFKSSIGKGGVKNLVHAELAKQVDHLMAVCTQFISLFSSIIGDMSSTATLMKDSVTAKAKAVVDTYTTAEGVAAAHIDNAVQKRVDALNKMMDQVMAMAAAAQGSTGPVLDMKLQAVQLKLQVLEAALDKLAAAVKAVPTPSEVVKSKMTLIGSVLSLHPAGKMILDPELFMAQLNGRIFQFKDFMAKTFGCTGVNCTHKP